MMAPGQLEIARPPVEPHAGKVAARPAAIKARWSDVRVCTVLPGGAVAVVEARSGYAAAGVKPEVYAPGRAVEARRRAKRHVTVALIPRSLYLTRTVEAPLADAEDTRRMLLLDLETEFPPEFGEVDLSFRALGENGGGLRRYEAYIVRRQRMHEFTAALDAAGLCVDYFLPSAVFLASLLEGSSLRRAAATWWGTQIEGAVLHRDGSLSVRSIRHEETGERRELLEYLRWAIGEVEGEATATIGWAGGEPPAPPNGRFRWGEIGRSAGGQPTLLHLAADIMLTGPAAGLETANLLPLHAALARRRHAVMHSAIRAGAVVFLGLAVLFAALQITAHRYTARRDALLAEAAGIRKDGRMVGARIEQLRVVHAARATRQDFTRIIAGLLEATPEGVTYSQVELDDEHRLLLRGQAESLSLPFLLPQKLEASPVFSEVLLRDAGQTNQGQGSVVEFRLEAKLERGGGE